MSDRPLIAAAERDLAFLVRDLGFEVVSIEDERVRFESGAVAVTLTAYRSEGGQVDIRVARLGYETAVETLSLSGMVGTASLSRVVDLLAERLKEAEDALRGDQAYFERLAGEQRRLADEWTAYYAGRGSRPQTGKLPP